MYATLKLDSLCFQVNELSAALSEERAAGSHASELLEGETMERMRMERQLNELQVSRLSCWARIGEGVTFSIS